MRTEREIQAKLAECLTHATPKYNADGDCSLWTYWHQFASVLRGAKYATKEILVQFQEAYLLAGSPQQAAMYSWLLEDPTPVITEETRTKAERRAERIGKPVYLWADKRGTHVSEKHPGRRCEVIEPKIRPRKRTLTWFGPKPMAPRKVK